MKRVLAFGTFDRLHEGHKNFLAQARAHGDELYVVIALDETVEKIKKHKPHHSQEIRQQEVQAVPSVTKAVLGNSGDKMKVIRDYKPDVICLGYDQTHFVDVLNSYVKEKNLKIEIKRMQAFKEDSFKSSKMNSYIIK